MFKYVGLRGGVQHMCVLGVFVLVGGARWTEATFPVVAGDIGGRGPETLVDLFVCCRWLRR